MNHVITPQKLHQVNSTFQNLLPPIFKSFSWKFVCFPTPHFLNKNVGTRWFKVTFWSHGSRGYLTFWKGHLLWPDHNSSHVHQPRFHGNSGDFPELFTTILGEIGRAFGGYSTWPHLLIPKKITNSQNCHVYGWFTYSPPEPTPSIYLFWA